MDLIEGIGERYLMGKANAAPQMLENLAKKQFSSATDTKAQAAQASTLSSPDKDEEIAKLRKQLAETKLEKGKTTGEARAAKSSVAPSMSRTSKSAKSKANVSEARSSGGSALAKAEKEMKGLPPLSIGEHRTPSSPKTRKKSPESTRGRRASTHTATAAAQQAHPRPPSETRSGMYPHSKPGKSSAASIASQSLEPSLGAKEALLQTKKSSAASARHQAAPSAASSAYASSARRHSVGEVSEVRSNAASVATRPPPPLVPQYEPAKHVSREKAPAYTQVMKQEPVEVYEEGDPEMYVIEVVEEEEEEAPRLRKGVRQRPRTGGRGAVEVMSSSKGRTVYRVS